MQILQPDDPALPLLHHFVGHALLFLQHFPPLLVLHFQLLNLHFEIVIVLLSSVVFYLNLVVVGLDLIVTQNILVDLSLQSATPLILGCFLHLQFFGLLLLLLEDGEFVSEHFYSLLS